MSNYTHKAMQSPTSPPNSPKSNSSSPQSNSSSPKSKTRRVRFNDSIQIRLYTFERLEVIDKLRHWYTIHDDKLKNIQEVHNEIWALIDGNRTKSFEQASIVWRRTQCMHFEPSILNGRSCHVVYGGIYGWDHGYVMYD